MNKTLFGGIFAAAGLAAGLLLRSEYERKCLTAVYYKVDSGKKLKKKRRLAFLSDMHNTMHGKDNTGLLKAIDEAEPDAVLIGGDMPVVKGKLNLFPAIELCEELTLKYPVYYANGNHEQRMRDEAEKYPGAYDDFRRSLEDMGVIYLSDEGRELDSDIMIYGLDIDEKYYRNFDCAGMPASYIRKRLGEADRDKFCILLAHSPLFFDAYSEWGADLTLSGHFHGGTVRLPGEIGLMTPQFQFFNTNVTGIKKRDGAVHIISSGLGTHSINIRLNNKPQLVIADIGV